MKIIYGIVLILMLLVSACAQQTAPQAQQQPVNNVVQEVVVEEPAGQEAVEEVVAPEESGVGTSDYFDVSIVGKEGFDPLESKIASGNAITWMNNDKKELILTFFKDGKFYLNTPKIKPGEKFEHQFNEKGSYEYWSIAYGQSGAKIIVE